MKQLKDNNQLISDFIDDQIESGDLESIITDVDSKNTLFRYNTVSEILKDEYSSESSMSFVNAVREQIANAPTVFAPNNAEETYGKVNNSTAEIIPLFAKIKKATGGMAIAASVAVATFFSVQTLQVANDGNIVSSEVALQNGDHANQINTDKPSQLQFSNEAVANNSASELLDTPEQKELELFNDMFMRKARQSEQASIAPFARAVRGQGVGTIRFSKEQWENIVKRSSKIKELKQKESEQTEGKTDN